MTIAIAIIASPSSNPYAGFNGIKAISRQAIIF
jgi:hypothetical protein